MTGCRHLTDLNKTKLVKLLLNKNKMCSSNASLDGATHIICLFFKSSPDSCKYIPQEHVTYAKTNQCNKQLL